MKYVYAFGEGKAEGTAKMKDELGGKGANLAEMTNLGIPVPPGFTITAETNAAFFETGGKLPEEAIEQCRNAISQVEKIMGDLRDVP